MISVGSRENQIGACCTASALALKKTTRAAEQDRPDVAAARKVWRSEQSGWDPRRLVFIDETALNTKMARLYGWSLRGQRCIGAVPHGHWATSTFIAALRHDRIDAPFLIEGSANMEVFAAYVGQVLCPELNAGDEVIMDNLCIHKTPVVNRLIEARGAKVRYLPPTART